ncbi:hydroxypyruvate isomerase family protein [Variovorax sp. M-6]|uniref:hydroxypyruvate isomerase family protein n=1 Tax=Variovorax sp. M-6 TaxID=3233041 RepID=UPI003F95DE2E
MRLAANLSWLYGHLPEPERFAAAARDGFTGVEILLPYEQPAEWYGRMLRENGLQLVLFNTPIGPAPGHRGLAAVAGQQAGFRRGFARALEVAQATGCTHIHVMAGNTVGLDSKACRKTLLENLAHALPQAEQQGRVLTLEALNRIDMAGYFYHLPSQAIDIVRHFDSPHLRLQFDFYHCAREGLDLSAAVREAAPWIGHVQIAGTPGRHEPDLGQNDQAAALSLLAALGYDGWLGCEYQPRGEPLEGLRWCAPLRAEGVIA